MSNIKLRVWNGSKLIYDLGFWTYSDIKSSVEVTQFISMYDKNQQEIWEHDIVLLDGKHGYVMYAPAFARYAVRFHDHDTIFDTYSDITVVGNYYEHKSLLEP